MQCLVGNKKIRNNLLVRKRTIWWAEAFKMTFPGFILDPALLRSQEEALIFAGSGEHFGLPCDSPEWLLLSKAE